MTPKTYLRITLSAMVGCVFYVALLLVIADGSILFPSMSVYFEYMADFIFSSAGEVPFIVFNIIIIPLVFIALFFKGLFLLRKYRESKVRILCSIGINIIFFVLWIFILWSIRVETFSVPVIS